jgi:membrane protein YdbS with pleckstrin-like domain
MSRVEILIPIAFFLAVVAIVKIATDHNLRRRLLDRGLPPDSMNVSKAQDWLDNPLASLKWAFVLIAIGTAFLVNYFFPSDPEIGFGVLFILAGVGLMAYFFVAKQQMKKKSNAE